MGSRIGMKRPVGLRPTGRLAPDGSATSVWHRDRRHRRLVFLTRADAVEFSTGSTKILPSPTVARAAPRRMACTVGCTKWSETPISSRTFSDSAIFTVVPR